MHTDYSFSLICSVQVIKPIGKMMISSSYGGKLVSYMLTKEQGMKWYKTYSNI